MVVLIVLGKHFSGGLKDIKFDMVYTMAWYSLAAINAPKKADMLPCSVTGPQ